jgi:hypothetical protein
MMSISKVARAFLFFLAAFQLSFVSASARSLKARNPDVDEGTLLTNAARFQHGYGPMKPRSMMGPSRVMAARDAQPSLTPVTGTIEVRNAGGLTMGFISKTFGTKGFGLATSPGDEMSVTFTPVSPFSMKINNPSTSYSYLGFDGGDLTSPIDDRKNFLVGTNPTAPGSRPVNVGAVNGGKTESAIWSFTPLSRQLTAQWVNLDFSSPNSRFWYYPARKAIGLVNENPPNSNAGQEVFLYLVV